MSICYERIKLLIEQSGLSYQELEKKTGVKKSSLQRYASGTTIKIPLDVIEKLAKAFNVSREYLIGLDVPMEKKTVTKKKENEKVKEKEYGLTDEEVEAEIARLNESEAVALARYEQRLKYRRRQYLYQLRDYEKKGKALMAAGMTREVLDGLYKNGNEND